MKQRSKIILTASVLTAILVLPDYVAGYELGSQDVQDDASESGLSTFFGCLLQLLTLVFR
jgi:hypothetical protein